tara:strand:+ start:9260 stop:10081 length:822 start_codon:yes stop_codon:yes gene_type:complete
MRGVLTVLRAETYRMTRTRSLWVAWILLGLLTYLVASLAGEEMVGAHGGTEGLGWGPMAKGLHSGLVIGTLGLAFLAARSLAGDADAWILRLTVTRSASRLELVYGRFLLGFPLVLSVIGMSLLGAWLGGLGAGGYGDIVIDNFPIAYGEDLVDEGRRAVLGIFAPMICVWAFGLFVSSLSPGATPAVAVTLAALLALDLFKSLLGDYEPLVFTTYVPALTGTSASGEFVGIAQGFSDSGLLDKEYRMGIDYSIRTALVCVALAAWRTVRRPL